MSRGANIGDPAGRMGAFEVLLGAAILAALGFVVDLIAGTLPVLTITFAAVGVLAGGARIWAGYQRGRAPAHPPIDPTPESLQDS